MNVAHTNATAARTPRLFTALAIAIALVVAACGSDTAPRTLSGYVLEPKPAVGGYTLPDASQGGAEFAFTAGEGRLLIVYFGYLSCPDICPTTLAEVRKALALLGDDSARVDLAMVTVDPARDTPELVTKYVQSFVAGAHGLRTDDDAVLRDVADAFGASYDVVTNADGSIDVSHSTATYVVDSNGEVVLAWPFGLKAQPMADDLSILFDGLDR